ncbi:GA module-containing protein [Candidatus Saccharibacteria bacterium]|nr:GA module-containing protein [Candidatus Saccharibacteria bacterium]
MSEDIATFDKIFYGKKDMEEVKKLWDSLPDKDYLFEMDIKNTDDFADYLHDIGNMIEDCFEDIDFEMVDTMSNAYDSGQGYILEILGFDLERYLEIMPEDMRRKYEKEARKTADEKRSRGTHVVHNTTIYNTQNIGSNSGIVVGVIQDSNIDSNFNQQIDEAIDRIDALKEITLQQREDLKEIMNEAKSLEEPQRQKSKVRFEKFMCGTGDISLKVISVLSDLSSIAQFFGFGGRL